MDEKKFEKLVLDIMKECEADGEPVSREEAEEMARMEIGAKEVKRYEHAETTEKKERKPKTHKTDEEKKHLTDGIKEYLSGLGVNILNYKPETEIEFTYGESHYTMKLVKHRPKK